MLYHAETISIAIDRPSDDVARFVLNPANLPQWAAGLGSSIRQDGKDWIVETAGGPVTIKFVPPNPFGVVDHVVILSEDTDVYIPMRVLQNGTGSEVLFTLFQLPGMEDDQFNADLDAVRADLTRLKFILESGRESGQ